jgi:hypothetical protein
MIEGELYNFRCGVPRLCVRLLALDSVKYVTPGLTRCWIYMAWKCGFVSLYRGHDTLLNY